MLNSELHFTLEEVLPKFGGAFQKKILHSVELLRKAEKLAAAYDDKDFYFLAFSGGKDSQCLYHIAKIAGVKFKAHMNLTSVDPPEVIRFVKKQYPDVDLEKPKKSIFQSAIDRNILPTMRVRWCCAEYKESAGAGKVTLIGIRHAESSRRAKRNEVEINNRKFSGDLDGLEEYRKENNHPKRGRKPNGYREVTIVNATGERTLGCIRGKESLLISPIIDWTEEDVWDFLNTLGIAHCELYDQGWKRIGCIGCPMSNARQKALENERWPHVKRNWIKAIRAIRNGGYSRENTVVERSKQEVYVFQANNQCFFINDKAMAGGNFLPRERENQSRIVGNASPKFRICKQWQQNPENWVSDGSLPDRLTDEQENEIAENIYDWWISGKGYQKWYDEKFNQQSLEFKD